MAARSYIACNVVGGASFGGQAVCLSLRDQGFTLGKMYMRRGVRMLESGDRGQRRQCASNSFSS
jgi:hypothetical protein